MRVLSYVDYRSTDPAVEPVTVAEAKRNCDVDDGHWDQDFNRWISEARKQVEHDARLSLINQTRIRKQDAFPAESYIPLRKPLVSVTSLQYIDTSGNSQTWDSSNYEVDTNRGVIWLAYSIDWPNTRDIQNAVTVTYVSGHGTTRASVAEAARAAVYLYVKHRYEHPDGSMDDFTRGGTFQSLIDQLKGGFYP